MRSMTRRTALFLLLIAALASWAGLLFFTHAVPPTTPLAIVTFFIILLCALTSTITLLAYGIHRVILSTGLITRKRRNATIRGALWQGVLLSLALIFNLVLRALSSWSPLTAIAILLIAIIIDIAIEARH
jgi:hypothetical protein